MIKIEKSYGVRGVADYATLVRLQELISLAKQQYGLVLNGFISITRTQILEI